MNEDKALESRMFPIEQVCYLFVYSLFLNWYSSFFFQFLSLEEKVSHVKGKLVS